MILSRKWRARDLERRLRVWRPLVGEAGTTTYARSVWWGQSGFLAGTLWVIVNIVLLATRLTGAPVAVAALVCWPVILFCFVQAIRTELRASREAGKVVGNSEKARPPLKSVAMFHAWAENSKYSRYRVSCGASSPTNSSQDRSGTAPSGKPTGSVGMVPVQRSD